MPTLLTLFSGGGLADAGYRAAGFRPVGAVEYDPAIAEWYIRNHGDHCHIASVADVDYRPYYGVTLLHLSPVCTRASVANQDATESGEDLMMADACCRAIREARPLFVVLENVGPYARFESFRRIVDCLRSEGYDVTFSVLNSADFGVPQTRKRLILRASRMGRVPALKPTHCEGGKRDWSNRWLLQPWGGWYAAVEDLIPTLPESRFADWQLKRLPEWLETCLVESKNSNQQFGDGRRLPHEPAATVVTDSKPSHLPKAFLIDGQQTVPNANGKRGISVRHGDTPALTVTASAVKGAPKAFLVHGTSTLDVRNGGAPSAAVVATVHAKAAVPKALLVDGRNGRDEARGGITTIAPEEPAFSLGCAKGAHRAWLEQGRVVAMTPRALARFQSLPDWYVLPDKAALACRIVGNGVPSLLAQRIGEAFLQSGGAQ